MMNNVSVFIEGTSAKKAFIEYILRINCDEAVSEEEIREIKGLYKKNFHDCYLDKIGNDEETYIYYIDMLMVCVQRKICFKSLLDIFISADIEYKDAMRLELDKDRHARDIKEVFKKINDGILPIKAIMENEVTSGLEEMIKNSLDEAKRLLNKYLPRLKKPLDNLNIALEEDDFILINNMNLNFNKKKVFTKIVDKTHSFAPFVEKGDIIFFTEDDKIIHLPFTRGLFIGYIQKLIINSPEIEKVLLRLKNSLKYLHSTNFEGELDAKIYDIKGIVKFIDWGLKHKRVIEYYSLAKHMSLCEDDAKKFAARLSENNGKSFKNNIAKLLSSNSEDIQIERLVDISGYDSFIVHD